MTLAEKIKEYNKLKKDIEEEVKDLPGEFKTLDTGKGYYERYIVAPPYNNWDNPSYICGDDYFKIAGITFYSESPRDSEEE